MKPLIFATNNAHKVEEVKSILNNSFHVLSLKEANINIDIPEPFETIKENACEKARVIYSYTGKNCFAEDTGLEVFALEGAPGVRSARYAGENASFGENIDLLLQNLIHFEDRSCRFKTIICLIIKGEEYTFEGICNGYIIHEKKGAGGFGYDAIFVPEGREKTFAEMKMDEKNIFSHRKKAMDQLVEFLMSVR